MGNPPVNPAAANVARAVARHGGGAQVGAVQPGPQRFSEARRKLLAKQAGERSELETQQWNDRVDMTERHAAEVTELEATEAPAAPTK